MSTQFYDTTTHRGLTVPLYRTQSYWVYLLHFEKPYKHAAHYLGSTGHLDGPTGRLARHKSGNGARLVEVIMNAGISFRLARLWKCESSEEARALEKKLKSWHGGNKLCPICRSVQPDYETFLRAGHFPFDLFRKQARPRRPMADSTMYCHFVRGHIE